MKPQLCKDCEHSRDGNGNVSWPKQCGAILKTNYVSGYQTKAYCDDIRNSPTCEKFKKKEKSNG